MQERVAAACREGGGNAGGSFTKRIGARITKAKDERKRCRAQPPTIVRRMGDMQPLDGVMGSGHHIANPSGPNY
jgi:hypothetical protein